MRSKRKVNLYLTILDHIKKGKRPSEISKELNISKQALQHYLSTLKRQNCIKKIAYGTWKFIKPYRPRSKGEVKVYSLGSRPITNLHALQLNFPILEGEIKDSAWKVKEKLKHWLPKYTNLDTLGGLTLKNNNNKSLTVFAKSRNIKTIDEVDNLVFQIRTYIFEFFKRKHGVILDIVNAEVKNLNLATEDRQSEGMIRKGEKFELDLKKKAAKILPPDKIDAKAWIDGSPFEFTAETNDKDWKKAYLQMPFNIAGLTNSLPALEEYNTNLKLHIAVQTEQLKTAKEIQNLIKTITVNRNGKL